MRVEKLQAEIASKVHVGEHVLSKSLLVIRVEVYFSF